MTDKQLAKEIRELIRYWQRQLWLPNWKFKFRIHTDPKEIKGSFALNEHSPNNEVAFIHLLHPDKIPEDWIGVRDLEVTIVHEMVHTRLIYVAHPSKKRVKNWNLEMAVEVIAKALVANRRGIDPEELK